MKCQNCDAPVLIADEVCQSCGAKLLHRRVVVLGVPNAGDFALRAEEPASDLDEPAEAGGWDFPARAETPPKTFDMAARSEATAEPRWGGFFRRAGAFFIDLIIIVLLSALMGVMAYIGYRVGLTAHNRVISWSNAAPLLSFLTVAWMGLATTYFVVFHGMEGKTICVFADAAAWPIQSYIAKFRDEFETYIRTGRKSVATEASACLR